MTLIERVATTFGALTPTGVTALVAVSGGPDSLALLDLLQLSCASHRRSLVVGHVDHGTSAESSAVADQVAAVVAELGLPFRRVRLELGADVSETRARTARQEALRMMASDCAAQVIVLGHHADDQAETVLLRLLRGSGPAGLAGMAARTGIWIRPLLRVPRAELAAHLAARGIKGWSDPANRDPRHLRSWLRGNILPLLSTRLPDVSTRLLRSASQAAAARVAWDQIPALLLPLELRTDSDTISLAAPPLWGYRSELRHAVLAALGRRFGVPLGERRLAAIERLQASAQGTVRVAARLEVELFDARLTLRVPGGASPLPVELESGGVARVGSAEFIIADSVASAAAREGWSAEFSAGRYLARAWRRGDRIRPLNGRGSRAVSVLLREARVPVGRRPEWPVVAEVASATIVWVPGICRADAFIPEPGTKALHVECAFA